MVPEHNEGSIGMSIDPSSFLPPQPTLLELRLYSKENEDTPVLTELEASQGFTLAPSFHESQPTQIHKKGKDINERSQQSLAKPPIASAGWVRERRGSEDES